ncbi:hypothetical protein QOZ91_000010 [Clostridium sardiniense]|nr:hypothetical protein [Clostridium sardiniense]
MLYFILFIFFLGFYNSNLGSLIRFILTVIAIKCMFENLLTDLYLSISLFILILLLNIPTVFKIYIYLLKKIYSSFILAIWIFLYLA